MGLIRAALSRSGVFRGWREFHALEKLRLGVLFMELEFATWLDMVWEALSEEDAAQRVSRLKNANNFLEESRQRLISSVQHKQILNPL